MNCAYCLEELNPGATVCKVCAREQPLTKEQAQDRRDNLTIIISAGVFATAVVGFSLWALSTHVERSRAVTRVTECIKLQGDKEVTADYVDLQISMGMEATHKGLRAAMQYAALNLIANGLPAQGRCFITQETLFSD